MVRLVWIADGSEGALSQEMRALLASGSKLVRGVNGDHAAFDALESQGYRLAPPPPGPLLHFPLKAGAESGSTAAEMEEGEIWLFPGDGPGPDRPLYQLVEITDRLLGPGGCPWDQAQTHETLKKYLLEEAYEVLEAIDSGSDDKFREELGDLILQPVMHAQMKKQAGGFDIDDVANEIVLKLVRRHPHVFGDVSAEDADEVLKNWDRIKSEEKGGAARSILEGVPKGMASLLRAHEISKRAARSGFEWPDIEAVFDKLHEEEAELREAISSGDQSHVESEIGDLLFTAVNVARWAGVEPEEALRKMLDRFCRRFVAMETASDRPLRDLTLEQWDLLWEEAKRISDAQVG